MNVQCELCPKGCLLEPGQAGDCRIRVNLDGELHATTYGFPCSIHVDPIEKKPIFHFHPGSKSFSIATVGCNLHCRNCQNWEISQQPPDQVPAMEMLPDAIVEKARESGCRSIAYTYSEPVSWYEYTFDCAVKAREQGLENVLITAGYLNQKPMRELCKHIDSANINLKAYSDPFYRDVCGGTLKPVLDSLVIAKESGLILEVTNLVIPGLNDSDTDFNNLCRWIKENLGADCPLHFSRFFPMYLMRNLPPTPAATLEHAKEIARSHGLQYVYVGNVLSKGGENTVCPKCAKTLVERRVYRILKNEIQNGKCPDCGTEIYGKWS